jgi:hypothetical protein
LSAASCSLPLCLALSCLFSFHCNLLVTDMTTIEQSQYGMRKMAEAARLWRRAAPAASVAAQPGVDLQATPRAPKSGWRHNFVSNCGPSPLLMVCADARRRQFGPRDCITAATEVTATLAQESEQTTIDTKWFDNK